MNDNFLKFKILSAGFLLLLLSVAAFFFAGDARAEENSGEQWFASPYKIKIDAENKLLYVLSVNDIVTVLDAKDYSLVKKISIKQPLDIYIDNQSRKIYIASSEGIFVLKAFDKETISRLSPSEIIKQGSIIALPFGSMPAKILASNQKQKIYIISNGIQKSLFVINSSDDKITKNVLFDFGIGTDFRAEYNPFLDKIYLMPRRGADLLIIDPSEAANDKMVSHLSEKDKIIDFVFDEPRGLVYALGNDHLFLAVDAKTNKIISGFDFKKPVRRIFYEPDIDKIIVTSWPGNDLSFISPVSLKIEKTVLLPGGAFPEFLKTDEKGERIYVMNSGIDTFSVINAKSLEIEKTLPAIENPSGALFANTINQDIMMPSRWVSTNRLFVIKPSSESFYVPQEEQPYSAGFLDAIWKIYTNKENGNAYLLNNLGNFSKLTQVDPKNRRILWTVPLKSNPHDLFVDYKRQRLYVANANDDTVSVISDKDGQLLKTISVGDKPVAIAGNSDSSQIYVANLVGDSISILDLENNIVTKTIDAGRSPGNFFYDKGSDLLYVLANGDRSIVIVDGEKTIKKIAVPDEMIIRQAFFLGSPATGKICLVNVAGEIFYVYKEGDDFKTKFIKADNEKQIIDAIFGKNEDKIYLLDLLNKKIEIFDLQSDAIKSSISLSDFLSPMYLLDTGTSILAFIRGGRMAIINQETGLLGKMVSINNQNDRDTALISKDSVLAFPADLSMGSLARGVFDDINKKVYFPIVANGSQRGLAVFDVSTGLISDVLTYENVQKIKSNEANPDITMTFWQKLSLKFKIIVAFVFLFLLSFILIIVHRKNSGQPPASSIS